MPLDLRAGDVVRFNRDHIYGTDCRAGETSVVESYVEGRHGSVRVFVPDPDSSFDRRMCAPMQNGTWHFEDHHIEDCAISVIGRDATYVRPPARGRKVKPLNLP